MTTQSARRQNTLPLLGRILRCYALALIPILAAEAAPTRVDLAAAGSFRVFANSAIASTGDTFVYGDLGLSPGVTLSGFPPGFVTGTTHVADAAAAQAQADLALAYAEAAGRTQDVTLIAGEIGSLILTQGLYRSGAALAITVGDLTLDGQGDTNAVWIFQMVSALGVAASRGVILTNGARSANVFWQVGSSATLGANSTLKGTILASQSITMGSGATLMGRALAVNAAVTLDENIFTDEDTVLLVFPSTPGPVDLRSAAAFGVLAGSTVVSVGDTIVYGDLGISPGVALVGFPPGRVNGATHVGDEVAAQAQADLALAYADAAGRTHLAIPTAGEIGGLTLTQGLYTSGAALAVTVGDLTLDGQGDTNAAWIFQMGSTLNVAASRGVILINGARAANVIWQVGSSATLGANANWRGTILANQSITVGSGATFEGRALALNAAVTLDADTFRVENTVVLVTAPVAAGPYTAASGQEVNLLAQTIAAPAYDSTRFYALQSSTVLSITNISISADQAVLTYSY